MKPIHIICVCLLSGMFAGCSQEARRNFLKNYDPIGDAIDKSKKKRRVDFYKDRGASDKKARRLAFEDEVWADGGSEHTALDRHNWANPDYPER